MLGKKYKMENKNEMKEKNIDVYINLISLMLQNQHRNIYTRDKHVDILIAYGFVVSFLIQEITCLLST